MMRDVSIREGKDRYRLRRATYRTVKFECEIVFVIGRHPCHRNIAICCKTPHLLHQATTNTLSLVCRRDSDIVDEQFRRFGACQRKHEGGEGRDRFVVNQACDDEKIVSVQQGTSVFLTHQCRAFTKHIGHDSED